MFDRFIMVFIGGGLGALCRFLVIMGVDKVGWSRGSLGVLLCNLIGSFCVGWVSGLLWSRGNGVWAPLVITGFLGGFTTFSSFSYEVYKMLVGGSFLMAFIHVCGSVFLSIGAVFLGVKWSE